MAASQAAGSLSLGDRPGTGGALPSSMSRSAHSFATRVELEVSSRYLLYLPESHTERDDWPLVVFLHGSGERGEDLHLVRKHGLPRLIDEGLRIPAVVLAPQCPNGQLWTQQMMTLGVLIDAVAATQGADRTRVVATGLSLGGAGRCELAGLYPARFAAVAPLCGPWTWLFVTDETARIPTWVFHGDADEVVPIEESERLVEEIRQRGGDPRFTVYPGVGHNSWDAAYAEPELLDWLVGQRKK